MSLRIGRRAARDGRAPLVGTRVVTVHGQHRRGVSLKALASALILALLAAQSVLPPLALAAGLAIVLAGVVVADRLLIAAAETA